MRQRLLAMALAMALMFSTSFALAGDVDMDGDGNIGIGIDNVNTADANANAEQNQEQQQNQDQRQTVNFNSLRGHVSALPGVVGAITAPPIVADGRWHQLLCESFTVEELKNMKDSSSYVNREGFWLGNVFTSPVKSTLRVKRFKGSVSDGAVVQVVSDNLRNKTVAEYEGSGAKGVPMSAVLAYAALEGVYDTGEYAMVVYYRARDIATLSGVGIGSGASAAVSSSDSGKSGAMSVGAIIGSSEAYMKYVYDIKVKFVRASREALALVECREPSPPVVKPPPTAPKTCDPDGIWKRIKELEQKIRECTRFSFNNLNLRSQMGDAYIDLYVCTGDRRHLQTAIMHYEIAERNYLKGHDIKSHQAEANRIIAQVYYHQAGCIREIQGQTAAMNFAKAKHLERIPSGFAK